MRRTRNFVRELTRIAKSNKKKGSQVVAAIGTSAITLATLAPFAQAQTTTYDPTYLNTLRTAPLTAVDHKTVACVPYYQLTPMLGLGTSVDQLCNALSNSPDFWSTTTPTYYRVQACDQTPGGQQTSFVIGNLMVVAGDINANASTAIFSNSSTVAATINMCTASSATWQTQPGFTAQATSSPTAYFFSQKRHGRTVPTSANPTYSSDVIYLDVGRISDGLPNLNIAFSTSGTAVYGTDYGLVNAYSNAGVTPNSFVIPANTSSGGIRIYPTYNANNHPEKTVQVTYTAPTGYHLVTNANLQQTTRILALQLPVVAITPKNGTSLTPGSVSDGFILTRTGGDQTQPVTVAYQISGTASNGTDYGYLDGSATIPANQTSITVPVTVPARSGSTAIPQKTVTITPIINDTVYTVGTPNAANFTIPAYNVSNVTITNPGGGTTPGGGTLTPGSTTDGFTVNRIGGDTTQPLIVNYLVGGTATPGSDYTPLSGVVTIPAGQTTATVPLQVLPNSGTTAEPAETITITLQPGNGYTPDATNPTATYTIPAYNPPAGAPSITVSAPNGTTLTPGTTTNALTFTRTGSTTGNLPVYYKLDGTATSGSDYSGLSGQVTIPNGQSSVTVPITVPATATTGKTIGVTLDVPGSLYSPGTNTQATYTIGNRPTTQTSIDVVFDPTVPQLVVTRIGGDQNQPISVPLTIGGDALPGIDYTKIPDTVNFPGGQNVVKIPLTLLPGATPGRTVTVTVPGDTDTYTIPPTGTTTTTTTTTTKKDDGKGGGGSALAPIAGVAGVGGILAASGVFSSGGLASAASGFAAVPDYCTQSKGDIAWDILPGTNGGIIFARPDVTFSKLGFAYTKGQVKVKGQTVAWGGQSNASTPADALNLGNLDGVYNLQCLNLAQIEKASGKKLSDKPLGETGLMRQTTFVNLTKTAYQKAKTVGDVPGLAEMLSSKLPQSSGLTKEAISKMSFAELLQKVPQLAQVNLGSIAIGQIPGFMQVPLANFSDWKNFAVSEVPGLSDVPFSQFPTKPAETKPADAPNKTSQR